MKTILVVEDAVSMRGLIKGILENEGYKVVTAEDGVKGMAYAREGHFDLALVDVHMPNMDGISFVGKVRRLSEHEHAPILMLTTETSEYRKKKVRELGANGWLTKPFDPPRLVNAIKTLLAKSSSQAESVS